MTTRPVRSKVLVVDDEPSLRAIGKMVLESQGYEVFCAEDGFEGLAILKQILPDIIISDLRMPNMNGFEFLSVVRRRFPRIPVIVVSGEFAGLSRSQSVLADAFFTKGDYALEDLFAKVIALLHTLPERLSADTTQSAVWVNERGTTAVTCSKCFRTFPVLRALKGLNEAECDFCSSVIQYEIIGEYKSAVVIA